FRRLIGDSISILDDYETSEIMLDNTATVDGESNNISSPDRASITSNVSGGLDPNNDANASFDGEDNGGCRSAGPSPLFARGKWWQQQHQELSEFVEEHTGLQK
ncbi:hypothetical protein EV182_008492, partial [Spiromyces aspiralis]